MNHSQSSAGRLRHLKTWVWTCLCIGCFALGYGLCEFHHRGRERQVFCSKLTWAIRAGLLTVNADWLNGMEEAVAVAVEDIVPLMFETDTDADTTRNRDQDATELPASDIPSP